MKIWDQQGYVFMLHCMKRSQKMLRILFSVLFGMLFTGCAANGQALRGTDPQDVLDKTWQWESTITPVEKITVPNPERYTIKKYNQTGNFVWLARINSPAGEF